MQHSVAPAKVNLFLEVTDRRDDGFHNIESVFLEIALADELSVEKREDGAVTIECDRPGLPVDSRNLVVAAAELLRRECGIEKGAHFRLRKRIPSGAGLGGGSSNAAAALELANALWGTGLSRRELAGLGARIGSDVPFFLHGGTCLCRGRGEVIKPLAVFPDSIGICLVLSDIHSDTAAAYRGLRLPGPGEAKSADNFIGAMSAGDCVGMTAAAFNRFEETVFAALPELAEIREMLAQTVAVPVRMSGSGSGLWFFGTPDMASALETDPRWQQLRERHGVVLIETAARRGRDRTEQHQ